MEEVKGKRNGRGGKESGGDGRVGKREESCLINCKPKTATTQQLQVFLFTRRAN